MRCVLKTADLAFRFVRQAGKIGNRKRCSILISKKSVTKAALCGKSRRKRTMVEAGRWIMVAYGILMLLGGIGGYAMAKSVPSLIAGIASAILIGVAYSLSRTQPRAGLGLGTVVAVALVAVFVHRYSTEQKPMSLMLCL